MRLCVALPCFFKSEELVDSIKIVKQLGYDAVEMYNWKNVDVKALKKALEENEVEMISMCTSFFTLNDLDLASEWLDALEQSCIVAKELNVKRLITQVGMDNGKERAIQHSAIVSTLKRAIPILEKHDVTVMIEPLNVLVDHKGYFMPSSKEAFEIVKEVNSSHVAVVYDIYHQQLSEGNIIPSIIQNMPYIAHLHSAGSDGRHELDMGENDYKYIFDRIDKAGYKGCCGLEYRPTMPSVESLKKMREKYC